MATATATADDGMNYHRMLNLSVVLAEAHAEARELEDEELRACGEEEIRAYYESGGRDVPVGVRERRCEQAGGGREVNDGRASALGDAKERAMLNKHEDAAADYRRHVFKTGIPFRKHGLFPMRDALLMELSRDNSLRAFQKATPGLGRGVFVTCESWAVGDDAAKRGLDLRYFYRERARTGSSEYPELVGVARVGDTGAIGIQTYNLAHGGCIETIRDEATAELVKCWRAPCCVTIEMNVKIKKPLPLHHTVKIQVQIKEVQSHGLRIWTTARLTDPSAPLGEDVLATCEAQLCDSGMLNRMREE